MIETRYEGKRGCGYRQPGGLYLVAEGLHTTCGRLPLPCGICPTCRHGLKASRGWTWVEVPALVQEAAVCEQDDEICAHCPLKPTISRAGLLWIGEQFYKSPTEEHLARLRERGITPVRVVRAAATALALPLGEADGSAHHA